MYQVRCSTKISIVGNQIKFIVLKPQLNLSSIKLIIIKDHIKAWKKYIYTHVSMRAKLLHLCPTLCNSRDCSPASSSVHGILQTRILEWVAMSSSRGSSPLRDRTRVSYMSCIGRQFLYHYCHLGSPCIHIHTQTHTQRQNKIESK